MSKSNTLETAFLNFLFKSLPWTLLNDDGNDPIETLSVALHTGDPGEDGTQATNEIAYFGYARVNVARTSLGWVVTDNSVSPAAAINFPVMLGGAGGVVTHFSVGTGFDDVILFSGPVTPNLTIAISVGPQLTTSSAITED